jgi:hypothetical protein
MAYTPTHTFVAGDTMDAGQVNKNISEVQEYLNGQIANADMSVGNCTREQLQASQYTITNNTFEFITGLTGGKTYSTSQARLTGICSEPSYKQSPTTPTYVWVANGGISFYLEDRARVHFTICASPITTARVDQGSASSRFYLVVDDVVQGETRLRTMSENPSPAPARNGLSTFWSGELLKGYHTIGVQGYTNADYTLFTAWTITVEAFYQNDNQPEGD